MHEIGKLCEEKGTMLFSDATQAAGKIPVHPRETGVQLLALSAHKFHGPKGTGALYISRRSPRVKLTPLIHGGGHEEGVRSGTLNVPGIVGLGAAIALAQQTKDETGLRLKELRDSLESRLLQLPSVNINGDTGHRLSHVSNARIDGIDGAALMSALSKELAIASGSACTSANPEPSHVLQAMGLTRDQAKASLRISLGRYNTTEEVRKAVSLIQKIIEKLRDESIGWGMGH
jgi:cysteine desulfurase